MKKISTIGYFSNETNIFTTEDLINYKVTIIIY